MTQTQSEYPSMNFCMIRIAPVKQWGFTVSFTLSLSNIFFVYLSDIKPENSITELELEKRLAFPNSCL